MGSRATRSIVVVFVALTLASCLCLLGTLAIPSPANALDPGILTDAQARELVRVLGKPKPSATASVAEKAAWDARNRVLGRAVPKAVPRLIPALSRLAVAGTAGYVVHHDLMYLSVAIFGDVHNTGLDIESHLSPDARTFKGINADGTMGSVSAISRVEWTVGQGYRAPATAKISYVSGYQNFYCYRPDVCYAMGGEGHHPLASFTGASPTIHESAIPSYTYDPARTRTFTGHVYTNQGGRKLEVNDFDARPESYGLGPRRVATPLCDTPGCSVTKDFSVFELGAFEAGPATAPGKDGVSTTDEEETALYRAMVEDGEYDPSLGKPWLSEDFRAPSDPLQREALWGPVVGTWTTPSGGQCKEYQYGAKICDSPGGSTFVWIVKDWTAWMQSSGGGKEWFERPENRPSQPSGSGSGTPGYDHKADHMDDQEAALIANHAINNGGHHVPGIEPWNDVQKLADYVKNTVIRVEFGKEFGQVPAGLEGPYYPETGDRKAYWDDNRKVIIIRNPADTSGGTVFKPDREPGKERDYLMENFRYSTPPGSR